MREDTRGRVGRWTTGNGALEALKAWCEVRTGKTPGPSDVAEERRRPCRAQWGHDLYAQAVGEARSPALIHPSAWNGYSRKIGWRSLHTSVGYKGTVQRAFSEQLKERGV